MRREVINTRIFRPSIVAWLVPFTEASLRCALNKGRNPEIQMLHYVKQFNS